MISCCGIQLPPLEAEDPDEEHAVRVERIEDEFYVSACHEMSKDHFISFFAYVTMDLKGFRSGSMNEVLPKANEG